MNKLHIYKAIPNLFTIGSFVLGFSAINLAIFGRTKESILFVILSCILDSLDGKVARKLGVDGKFGAELDSFADMISFGIATSIIVLFAIDPKNSFLFAGSCFFSICCMLRLTRYNLHLEDSSYKNFFTGVPTPAGFGLAILPLSFSYSFNNITINPMFYSVYLIIIGFLMISILPTPSLKGLSISKKYFLIYLGLLSLLLVGLINYLWLAICFIGVLYIFSILLTIYIDFTHKKN